MKIRLTKKHKLHTRFLPVGSELGVEPTLGMELIDKGVAEDLSGEYKPVKKKAKKDLSLDNSKNDSKESKNK
jgi:hypothetical protein